MISLLALGLGMKWNETFQELLYHLQECILYKRSLLALSLEGTHFLLFCGITLFLQWLLPPWALLFFSEMLQASIMYPSILVFMTLLWIGFEHRYLPVYDRFLVPHFKAGWYSRGHKRGEKQVPLTQVICQCHLAKTYSCVRENRLICTCTWKSLSKWLAV